MRAYEFIQGVAEAINPDITNPAFSHEQQIGDYLYVARYWSKGLKISAYHGDKQIGYAELMYRSAPFDDFADPKTTPKRIWLESEWTKVNPKYQRQGIMSTMYAYAKMLGNSVKPSQTRSDDAKAAWASWHQSGDAKYLTRNEGVAEGKMDELEMDLEDPEITDRQFEKMYGMTRKEAREQFSQTDMWAFPEIRDPNRPLHEQGVSEVSLIEFAPPGSDGDGEDERSRRIRKLLEIAIKVAKEKNVDKLSMVHAMNMIAGDDFFSVAVDGLLPDITDHEYMFVLQTAYKTVKQGVAEGLSEAREGAMREIIRKELPSWPDYVIKDWISSRIKNEEDLKNLQGWLGELNKMVQPNSWKLHQKMFLTFNMLNPKTRYFMKTKRKFGDRNPFMVPRDKERLEDAIKLVQAKGIENLPPVIMLQHANGLELCEGWHRIMAAFRLQPEGFYINAWIGQAGQQGIAESTIIESTNTNILVVDVQPTYDGYAGAVVEGVAQMLNQSRGSIYVLYNAEGQTQDDYIDVINYLIDRGGMKEQVADRINYFSKEYGFFRAWMDQGVPDSIIIKTVRAMVQRRVNDSRMLDINTVLTPQEQKLFQSKMRYSSWEDEGIYMPDFMPISILKQISPFYMVGGGRRECLREIELLCNAFNIRYKRIDSLIYG